MSKFDLLYGGRLGINSEDRAYIAPVLAGEYYFNNHFSVGSEVQLRAVFGGDDVLIMSHNSVLVRFYF
ncbi:MAG: hypothetical protein HC906_02700 [Bacteroidales bacterium]|nr:hypothetical protein [Bacteroidales bacterium]